MAGEKPTEFDVAVIGAGLVGAATAFGLAHRGSRVVILDEGDVAFRASRGNFGLVWVQGKGASLPGYAQWTRQSANRWPELASLLREITGIDVCYTRPGGLMPALGDREFEANLKNMQLLQAALGPDSYPYDVLDGAALARMVPGIGQEVSGALHCPLDGHANPLKLFRALHSAMQIRGGTYIPFCPVETVAHKNGCFRIISGKRQFEARRVVLAAGLGAPRLAPMLGLEAAVQPNRGHIIVTERTAPFLHHLMLTIRQTDEGSVLIGDAMEEAGFDDTLNLGIAAAMAQRAKRLFPALGRLNVVRNWAALRVMTPDGYPIYDQSSACPGAFLATCHSGVTLAAAHALSLANYVAEGTLPDSMRIFSAGRLHVQQAA